MSRRNNKNLRDDKDSRKRKKLHSKWAEKMMKELQKAKNGTKGGNDNE
jgi:hypothetical protein